MAAGNQNKKPKKRRNFRNNAFHWDPNPPPTHLQVDHLWPKTEQKKNSIDSEDEGGRGAKGKRLTNIADFEKERSFRGDNGKNAIEDRPFFGGQGGGYFE